MTHVVFSKQNLKDYLWLDDKDIKQILIGERTCLVQLVSGEKVKVTAEEILPIMEEKRRERAKNINIQDLEDGYGSYVAINPIKDTEYLLRPYDNYVVCSCDDWKKQSIYLNTKQVCCKHIHALFRTLAVRNLQEYIEMVEEEKRLLEEAEIELQRRSYYAYGWHNDARYW